MLKLEKNLLKYEDSQNIFSIDYNYDGSKYVFGGSDPNVIKLD